MRFFKLTVFTTLILFLNYNDSFCQKPLFNSKKPVIDYLFKKEASAGLKIAHNGFTLFGQFGWIKNIYQTTFIEAEYFYHHDYRFKKIKSPIQNGRDFYLGVQNRLHVIRIGAGFKRTIADKADKKGVRLSIAGGGGFSLALLKPYYLNLYYPDTPDSIPVFKDEPYMESNKDRFVNRNYIAEASPSYLGMSNMDVVAGLHGKLCLDFDFGSKDAFVKAVEAGVIFDVYYKKLPLTITDNNRLYMGSFYVAFRLGKRW